MGPTGPVHSNFTPAHPFTPILVIPDETVLAVGGAAGIGVGGADETVDVASGCLPCDLALRIRASGAAASQPINDVLGEEAGECQKTWVDTPVRAASSTTR